MTVPNQQDSVQYFTATGSSGSFAFTGSVFDADALTVYVVNPATSLISTPAFTVTLADDYSGATVVVPSGLANGYLVAVARVPICRQTADLGYQARIIERQLDRVAQDLDALDARVRRSARLPLAEDILWSELPTRALRQGQVLGFDANGIPTLLANVPVSPQITLGTIWQTALLTSTAALARTALGAIGAADSPSITGTFDFTGGRIKVPTRAAGDNGTDAASTAFVAAQLAPLLRGHLAGLGLSNDGTTPNSVLDIAAGACADSAATTVISLASAMTKSTAGVWAAGTGQNGMGQGLTIQNNTWYHVIAILNGGAADAYFDTDIGAANKPVGTTAFRRIGSFKTDGSAHILPFVQSGDNFLLKTPVVDQNNVSVTTNGNVVWSLPSVPPGLSVQALVTVTYRGGGSGLAMVYSGLLPALAALPASGNAYNIENNNGRDFAVLTDTSQQIQIYNTVSGGPSTPWFVITRGWIDRRGRDG